MKLYVKCLLIGLLILFNSSLSGQNSGVSQLYFNESEFNPAGTGIQSGLKSNLTHLQYFDDSPFSSQRTSLLIDDFDRKFLTGGIGLSASFLEKGQSLYTDDRIGLAYAKRVTITPDFVFQIGMKGGYSFKKADTFKYINMYDYVNALYPLDTISLINNSQHTFNFSSGILFLFLLKKDQVTPIAKNTIGIAFNNIFSTEEKWIENVDHKLGIKTTLHWTSVFKIKCIYYKLPDIYIAPGILYEINSPTSFLSPDLTDINKFTFGMNARFFLTQSRINSIFGGFYIKKHYFGSLISEDAYYENQTLSSDSYSFLVGFEKMTRNGRRQWRVSYNYDLPINTDKNWSQGVHELALTVDLHDFVLPGSLRSRSTIPQPADRFQFMNSCRNYSNKDKTIKEGQSSNISPTERERKNIEFNLLIPTEINDFSKSVLWEDILENNLTIFKSLWNIYPQKRYSVQVKNSQNFPVVNALVKLKSAAGEVIWTAKTDNTGKAELWSGMFNDSSMVAEKISVNYNDKVYTQNSIHPFDQGINSVTLPVQYKISDTIEIGFMVDVTGSKDVDTDFMKSDLLDFIAKIKSQYTDLVVKYGNVFYRYDKNLYITRSNSFTSDIEKAPHFVEMHDEGGGGTEVVKKAFKNAIEDLEWSDRARTRILFLILDEQPITTESVVATMNTYTEKAAAMGIRVVPVIASAETMSHSLSMEYLMRSIALATNGTYVALTDHSNIGDKHATPTTDEFDVELLNSLMKRLIYQYTYVPGIKDSIDVDGVSDTTTFSNSPVIAHVIVDSSSVTISQSPTLVKDTLAIDSTLIDQTIVQDIESKEEMSDSAGIEEPIADTVEFRKIEIKFYPNPTTGKITVAIDGDLDILYLFDFSGKLVARYDVSSTSEVGVDLSSFSVGVYYLKFMYNEKWYSGKVILKR